TSEERRLRDRPRESHQALLQVRRSDRHPTLIRERTWGVFHLRGRLRVTEFRHELAESDALRLDLVHQVDLALVQLAVPSDLAVLILHHPPLDPLACDRGPPFGPLFMPAPPLTRPAPAFPATVPFAGPF